MILNIVKNIKKFVLQLSKLSRTSKLIMRYGTILFLASVTVGSCIILINFVSTFYNPYLIQTGKYIILASFNILAETIVGGIIFDFIFGK